MPYASKTKVEAGSSRDDIERTLKRYGASGFMYGWQADRAAVGFEMSGRRVRFEIPMPDRSEFELTAGGQRRGEAAAEKAYEQETRRLWRALLLVVKAKLEAVESGISTFEDEFLAAIVLPDGTLVGDFMRPQLAQVYASGGMPPLLPGLAG